MKSSVENECYRLTQQIAVTKYPFCVRCGSPSTCGHHLFTRSRPACAFDSRAVLGVCTKCHNWIEEHPGEGQMLAISVIGQRLYDRLELQSRSVCRFRAADYREIRQELRAELKGLENGTRAA